MNGHTASDIRKRWGALVVLCLGVLMTTLDGTIVNVALPSIRTDLAFSETSLVWVVNAYLLTFGGFLLLGGRLGDLFGSRRLFLLGIALFTLASLSCGVARSQGLLIGGRAIQGVGGAVVSAVALSLTVNLFTDAPERAKAMGIYGSVSTGGVSIGLLLGGTLTSALDWHWIFLVNLPIGAVVYALGLAWLPESRGRTVVRHLDAAGAITVTTSLMLLAYAVVNGNEVGWNSVQTVATSISAVALLTIFFAIEAGVRAPLVPLGLFQLRNLSVASIVAVLWAIAMFGWFFNSALYLQLVLRYSPLQIGLAFLPSTLVTAVFSLGLSAKLVIRFGIKAPLAIGLLLAAIGLVLLARAPADGVLANDVLPGMLLFGLGGGLTSTPLLLAAMSGVAPSESGVASGVLNTAFTMGGAIGLAILVSVAAACTKGLLASGVDLRMALNRGYHMAFLIGAGFAAAAALASIMLLRLEQREPNIQLTASSSSAEARQL